MLTYGLLVLGLFFGMTVSAIAIQEFEEDDFIECTQQTLEDIRDFNVYEAAAEKGDPSAQSEVAVMYFIGQGVIKDIPTGIKWLEKSANQGDATAQHYLGLMYNRGYGVRQSKMEAKKWFGKACDNGSQSACDEYRKLNQK